MENSYTKEMYLGCVDVAKFFNLRPSAISNAMKRGSLKYIKVGRIRKTTLEWFEEYLEDKHKLERRRNKYGNRVYSKESGLYTIREAAKELRTCTSLIYKYLRDGYIKLSTYKNANYVVTTQQLEEIRRAKEMVRKNKGKEKVKA